MFATNLMTLQRAGQTVETDIPVQLDTVNIDIILNSRGLIPTDSYDAYGESLNAPARSDYLIDQDSGTLYNVFGNPAVYSDHWEARVTKYLGTTP